MCFIYSEVLVLAKRIISLVLTIKFVATILVQSRESHVTMERNFPHGGADGSRNLKHLASISSGHLSYQYVSSRKLLCTMKDLCKLQAKHLEFTFVMPCLIKKIIYQP